MEERWPLLLLGAYPLICAVLNVNWFFNSGAAQIFVKPFGRSAARVIYAILGIFLMALAVSPELIR